MTDFIGDRMPIGRAFQIYRFAKLLAKLDGVVILEAVEVGVHHPDERGHVIDADVIIQTEESHALRSRIHGSRRAGRIRATDGEDHRAWKSGHRHSAVERERLHLGGHAVWSWKVVALTVGRVWLGFIWCCLRVRCDHQFISV